MELSFSPIGGYLGLAVVGGLLLVLVVMIRPRDGVSSRRWRVLGLLRAAAICLLLLVMLRPAIVYTETTQQAATLVMALDRSRSMQIADMAGQQTRWQAMHEALRAAWPTLQKLDEALDVRLYLFADDLVPLPIGKEPVLDEQPTGEQTAIGAALDDVLSREAGKRLLGIVLLSDGAQRALPPRDAPPQMAGRRLADLGYPLFALPLGQSRGLGQTRDLAIEELLAPESVFVKNEFTATARARIEGYANQDLTFQFLVEDVQGQMQNVAASQQRAPEDGWRLPLEFEYAPEQPGEYKIAVRVMPQPGELVVNNNEMSTFIQVLKGGLNVLYIEGTPRVEQKFLRRALEASPDIQVDYLRIDAQDQQTRPSDLLERLQPGRYDVYLLGDIDSTAFRPEELSALASAVERGAGLMMLGGFHSFGAGGYGTSPLAEVLPITFDRLERQPFGEAMREDLHLPRNQPVQLRLTPQGAAQSLLQLAPRQRNAQVWAELAPLEGANRFHGLKPGAVVLAESVAGQPLLVAKDYGVGRVLAFAGDSTWRWWMSGQQSLHKRFWRQAVLWLARKENIGEGNVWVRLEQRRYAPAGRVELRLGSEDSDKQPIPDAQYRVQIATPGGQAHEVRWRREGDQAVAQFLETQTPGDYRVTVEARHAGQVIGTTQARFLVYEQDLELDNPAADRGALESLASMTGGRTIAPEQLASLLEELLATATEMTVETQTKRTLWDSWPVLMAMVGLLGLEWYLRKRWGLV